METFYGVLYQVCFIILLVLLFTPSKKVHIANLEDLLKALLQMVLKYPQSNVSYLKQNYNIWEM